MIGSPGLVSGHIDIGQIVTSLLLLGIGFGLRQTYLLIHSFVNRVNDNETMLMETTEVVDLHSVSLVKAGLLENASVKKLHMGRRVGDPTYIVIDKVET